MADKKYGIVLTAKDEASKAVVKLAGALGASTNAVKKLGSGGVAAFKTLGASIIVANQALELLSKVFGAVSGSFSSVMDAFRELRGETNPLVRQLDALKTRFSSLKASLGTAFASAIVAVGKAFDPVIEASLQFLENNRKLIASKIVEYFFELAKALVGGTAGALSNANLIWATLNRTIDQSIISVTSWLGAWTETMLAIEQNNPWGSEEQIKLYTDRLDYLTTAQHNATVGLAETDAAFVKHADTIQTAKNLWVKLTLAQQKAAVAMAKSGAAAAGATPLEDMAQALNRLKDQAFGIIPSLDELSKKMTDGLGAKEGTLAFEEFERRLDHINGLMENAGPKSIETLKASLETLYSDFGHPLKIDVDTQNVDLATQAFQIFTGQLEVSVRNAKEAFILANEQAALLVEKQALLKSKAEDSARATTEAWGASAKSISMSMVSAFAAGASAQEVFTSLALDGLTKIVGAVAEAAVLQIVSTAPVVAAKGAESVAATPFIGPMLAGATMAAMLAMVLGYKSKVPEPKKFSFGGIVPGAGDQDTVPALLTPGELVIPKEMTKKLLAVAKNPQRAEMNRGGIVGSSGAGGGIVINFNDSSIVSRSPAEQDKWLNEKLIPSLVRLRRRGVAF